MIMSMVFPFAYSMLLGIVWSACTKKKFYNSLAPAYMLHILLVLISGLVFKRLSVGLYGGIILTAIAGIIIIAKNRNNITLNSIYSFGRKLWDGGVFIFLAFYIFCFLTNYNKTFKYWDEFSHWGMFLKECLRLDSLYCMSPLTFAHKDYVPAITLFETIWCKLSGRYVEADVYRAIQIFMFSLLMPAFERISEYIAPKIKNRNNKIAIFRSRLFELGAVLMVLLIPLLFNTSNAFYFYHSIYCDVAVGILFFWCVFEAYREQDDFKYHLLSITIGMSILVLSKMTSMALLPLVIIMLFMKIIFFSKEKIKTKHCVLMIATMVVPVAIWLWFNKFVDRYVENTGGSQSYDGMKLSSLLEVFADPQNSAISYLSDVKNAYVDAIIHRDILIHGSYVTAILFIVIAFWILAIFTNGSINRKKLIFTGFWTLGAGLFYAMLMYFLYCTAFGEYEAVRLASYERYMNSFVISVLFLLLATYYDSNVWKSHRKSYYIILTLLIMDLAFLHVNAFKQVLPGSITLDKETVSIYTQNADVIVENTSDDSRIYIIRRGDNGDYLWHQRYYCNPRTIGGGSIGPRVNEGDIWSSDLTVEQFVSAVSNYDYIFFCGLDEVFIRKYSEAFEDPAQIIDGKIYMLVNDGSKIVLK